MTRFSNAHNNLIKLIINDNFKLTGYLISADNNFNTYVQSPVTQQPAAGAQFNIPPSNIHPNNMVQSVLPGNTPSNMFHMMSITEQRESRILSPVGQGNMGHNTFNHF